MSQPPIAWTSGLIEPRGSYVPVVRCPAEGKASYMMLDPFAVGVVGHWDPHGGKKATGRFSPCQGDTCAPHLHARALVQFFWISVWVKAQNRVGLAELRGEALRLCPELIPERGVNLTGRRLTYGRASATKWGRHIYEVGEMMTDDLRTLPHGVDVQAVLLRLWGFAALPESAEIPQVEDSEEMPMDH